MKTGPKPKPLSELFWRRVKKTRGCWLWTGAKTRGNYGELVHVVNRKQTGWRAHRLSWVLNKGEIPDGLQVLHRCDNPPCVNPEHLFLGTQHDNITDMWLKGRQAKQ